MTTRVWKTSGSASNPSNWDPIGAPQLGDGLLIQYLNNTTINVRGNDLAGDPITFSYSTLTANLTNHASMNATMLLSNVATFNLSGNSTLDLLTRSGSHVGYNPAIVNIQGNDAFTLHSWCSPVTVNISPGGRWSGTVNLDQWFGQGTGTVTVNGAPNSSWNNNGASVVDNAENLVINTDVVGRGSFNVTNTGALGSFQGHVARMQFMQSVGAHQEVIDSGLLVIDRPREFDGHVTLTVHDASSPTSSPGVIYPAEIDLVGLANADSYSFRNDMLRLYSGNTMIDRLDLTDATPHGFAVTHNATGLAVVAILDQTHPPIGLPLHV